MAVIETAAIIRLNGRRRSTLVSAARIAAYSRLARVGAVMHRGVIACGADCSGLNVARIMAAHRIHAVVLTLPGEPPRFVTDADIIRGLHEGTLATTRAEELARAAPILQRDDTLASAAERLFEQAATHAVVVADLASLRPVGVLSVLDIAEAIVEEADR